MIGVIGNQLMNGDWSFTDIVLISLFLTCLFNLIYSKNHIVSLQSGCVEDIAIVLLISVSQGPPYQGYIGDEFSVIR